MKGISMLIWLTQLGLSAVLPLAGFTLLGVWLHQSCNWGSWCVYVGVALGIICAVSGLRSSIAAMARMSNAKDPEPPAVSFNDHD